MTVLIAVCGAQQHPCGILKWRLPKHARGGGGGRRCPANERRRRPAPQVEKGKRPPGLVMCVQRERKCAPLVRRASGSSRVGGNNRALGWAQGLPARVNGSGGGVGAHLRPRPLRQTLARGKRTGMQSTGGRGGSDVGWERKLRWVQHAAGSCTARLQRTSRWECVECLRQGVGRPRGGRGGAAAPRWCMWLPGVCAPPGLQQVRQ